VGIRAVFKPSFSVIKEGNIDVSQGARERQLLIEWID
jgi:hypothetical protein